MPADAQPEDMTLKFLRDPYMEWAQGEGVPVHLDFGHDLLALEAACDDTVVGIMLTNPNTLGLFDEHVEEVIKIVHECGGLVYGDGANLNALVGSLRPGDVGVDLLHVNLHKTFAVPHGGGGPGGGAICVAANLEPFLPAPLVVRHRDGTYGLDHDRPDSIGRVHTYNGNFNAVLRSYAYILQLGGDGLAELGANAVLNANYLKALLSHDFEYYVDRICMHEFVIDGRTFREYGVRTLDIAKRLIDHGYHPPTVYFPLIAPEAIMIEPTETESKQTLDLFAAALIEVAREARETPDVVLTAPHLTPVGRLDEVRAARQPDLKWDAAEAAG